MGEMGIVFYKEKLIVDELEIASSLKSIVNPLSYHH